MTYCIYCKREIKDYDKHMESWTHGKNMRAYFERQTKPLAKPRRTS